jgi:hypothetical protein
VKTDSGLHQQFKIPIVVNHCAVLENLNVESLKPHHHKINQKPKVMKPKIQSRAPGIKVLIIRDSHAKSCAANLLHDCGKSFEVMGNVHLMETDTFFGIWPSEGV